MDTSINKPQEIRKIIQGGGTVVDGRKKIAGISVRKVMEDNEIKPLPVGEPGLYAITKEQVEVLATALKAIRERHTRHLKHQLGLKQIAKTKKARFNRKRKK